MIVITGVAGFIGAHVALSFLEGGQEIVGIDNLNDISDPRLKEYRLSLLKKHKNFIFFQKNLTHKEELFKIFDEYSPDTIIHLAARAGVRNSFFSPSEYVKNNVLSTNNLLELVADRQECRVVLASSSSVYAQRKSEGLHLGDATLSPFREDMYTNTPYSPYAASKIASEVLSSTFFHHFDNFTSMVNLRFFTVYGPFGRPDMSIFKFIQRISKGISIPIFGDGSQKRAFTYISDIVDGVKKACNVDGYKVLNLGNDSSHSVLELVRLIEKYLNKKAMLDFEHKHKLDIETTLPDLNKVKKELLWSPQISLDQGIKRSVEWHKKHSEIANSVECS